ncbi:MAG: hypothetical protein JWN76_482 [Chitinophagaceae bacterium]|nr:hypothetical protein [Chitinophagaceae bacterium]
MFVELRCKQKLCVVHSPKNYMAKSSKPQKVRTVYRDSGDGRFIKKKEAEKNPKGTEKERIKINQPKKK